MLAKSGIKSRRYSNCLPRAGIHAHSTKDTFSGEDTLPIMGIIEKPDVHGTFLFTNPAVNAFIPVNTELKQGKTA